MNFIYQGLILILNSYPKSIIRIIKRESYVKNFTNLHFSVYIIVEIPIQS